MINRKMIHLLWMTLLALLLLRLLGYFFARRLARPIEILSRSAEEVARGQGGRNASLEYGPAESLSQILGRPTDDSVTLSVLSASDVEAYVEFGDKSGDYSRSTETLRSNAGSPFEFELERHLELLPVEHDDAAVLGQVVEAVLHHLLEGEIGRASCRERV